MVEQRCSEKMARDWKHKSVKRIRVVRVDQRKMVQEWNSRNREQEERKKGGARKKVGIEGRKVGDGKDGKEARRIRERSVGLRSRSKGI